MKKANVAELKNNLSRYITLVEQGEDIEIYRRNRAVAKIVATPEPHVNKTQLGLGKGSVTFTDADLTEPFTGVDDWEMHS